jgi:uncharacterized damage-inducible protein DinB
MYDNLRYPLGRFRFEAETAAVNRQRCVEDLALLPQQLAAALEGLSDEQLDTPYRPEGWTVRQLVHHIADSHVNACIRFRWALTEDEPTIKAYDDKLWAELPDARTEPVEPSLQMLTGLHARWVALVKAMQPADFSRRLVHPENGPGDLERYTALYAWHGKHHVAHITALRQRMGW